MLQGTGFDTESYRVLCRAAIAVTTRILFLPKEHCVVRSIGFRDAYKPTGGFVKVSGRNFIGSFSMDYMDMSHHGLRSNGNSEEIFELGNHAAVDGNIRIDGRYYNVAFGMNACLADRGVECPMQVASPDFVQQWTEKVLRPLEFDIKSGAYVWTGDPKTDLSSPQRIV